MKSESKELSLFLLIFLGLFLIWIVTEGPNREISKEGKFLKPLAPIDSGETYDKWPDGESDNNSSQKYLPDSNQEKDTSLTNEEIEQKAEELKKKIEELEKNIKYSEFKDKISFITYKQEAEEKYPEDEYLFIKANSNNSQSIPLTNWGVESIKSGRIEKIGKGVLIPKFGKVNKESTIVLKPGESAYLITGDSPIGVSFKVTMCTGYLEQFQNFEPNISTNCPDPEDEMDDFADKLKFTYKDIDYIRSLDSCINPMKNPAFISDEARNFISENIHYSGCVKNHKNDDNFYSGYWMIYFQKNSELWEGPYETIYLLDEGKKLVDEYSFE